MTEGTKYSDSYLLTSGTEPMSPLYDTPRKINVQTFYEIMETQNLSLLKVNPKAKVSEETLNDVWLDLLEYYYTNTNQSAFKRFFNTIKTVTQLEMELVSCHASFDMVKLGDERGYEILRHWKINSTDSEQIRSAILRRETKLELARRKLNDNGKDEKVNFYRIVASVEGALNRQMNLAEINLERWVAYLNDIKEKQEAQKQEQNKRKGKKWQGK